MKLRIGIVGFGAIGERHFKNILKLKKNTSITVLTGRKDALVSTVSTFAAFAAQGPYDAIFICNETYKHAKTIARVAALSPKALFIEKPLAMNMNESSAIKRVLTRKKMHVFVGYSRQFYEPYLKIKKIVESGRLGKIYSVRVAVGQHLSEWRARDYRKGYSSSKKRGGGVVLDLVHEINFPSWLLEEPLTVRSTIVKKISDLYMNAEDVAMCIAEAKSGAVISIHLDAVRSPAKWQCHIVGEKGTLSWDSISKTLRILSGTKKQVHKLEVVWNDMFVRGLRFFLHLLSRKKTYSNLDEALGDQRIIHDIKKYGA